MKRGWLVGQYGGKYWIAIRNMKTFVYTHYPFDTYEEQQSFIKKENLT
jgi:hypothetical protein